MARHPGGSLSGRVSQPGATMMGGRGEPSNLPPSTRDREARSMGIRIRITPAGLLCLCVAVAGGVVLLVVEATTPDESAARRPIPITVALGNPAAGAACDERGPIEDGGLAEADAFLPPIHDPSSLRELRQAVAMRGRLGLAVLQAEYDGVRLPFRAPKEQVTAASRLLHRIGMLDLYEGRLDEAAACFRKAMELGRPVDI